VPHGAYVRVAGVAAFCVAWRVLSLGALENDHFVHLARAHQMLHGYWPLRDFSDPGLPGQYMLSALASWAFGIAPLVDVLLQASMLAIAAGLTLRLAERASGSSLVGTAVALVEVLSMPRLYAAPKLLVHAVAIALAWRYLDSPTRRRATWLGAWTACAFLLRHDHGLFVGLIAVGCLLARRAGRAGQWRGDAAALAGTAALLLLPWVLYVEAVAGFGAYLESALAFSRAEAVRTVRQWPGPPDASQSPGAAIRTVALYVSLALPPLLCGAAWRRRGRLPAAHLMVLACLLALCEVGYLRDRMLDRLPDIGAPAAIAAAALLGLSRRGRAIGVAAVAGALTVGAILVLPRLASVSTRVVGRLGDVLDGANRWPWTRMLPTPDLLPLVRYVDACTAPGDPVLAGWFAPEFSVFARRPFAGGHPAWVPGYYITPAEQAQIARWLEAAPPRVFLDDGTFGSAWPDVYAALVGSSRMTLAGSVQVDGRPVRIWFRDAAPGLSTYPDLAFPCPSAR
jgi:hypothetical protein